MRKLMFTAAVGAALLIAAPVAAVADDTSSPSPSASGYAPDQPTTPSLAGSTAVGECLADAPWIHYSLELTDPDAQATTDEAVLVMTNGSQSHSVPLGELVDGKLSGSILWPGASVDGNGKADGWPGWDYVNGQWVEVDDNFAWTRGNISTTIQVNPDLAVALSYPTATPECMAGPRIAGAVAGGALPATGMNAAVLPLGIAGGAVALVGAGLLVAQRRRRSNA